MNVGNVFCTIAPILDEQTQNDEPENKNKNIIDKLLTMNVAELTKGQLMFLNKILPQESQLAAPEGNESQQKRRSSGCKVGTRKRRRSDLFRRESSSSCCSPYTSESESESQPFDKTELLRRINHDHYYTEINDVAYKSRFIKTRQDLRETRVKLREALRRGKRLELRNSLLQKTVIEQRLILNKL